MIRENIDYVALLIGLLVIVNGAVVQSELVRKCYNDTGIPICFVANTARDQRLKNWTAAMDYCRTLNGSASLPIVMSLQDQFRLTEFLTENDFMLDSVWLGARGFSNGFSWTWMDKTAFTGSLNTSSLVPTVAGVSGTADGNATLVELELGQEKDGYICQYKDATVCSRSSSSSEHGANYTDGISCFVSVHESINWFLARNKCLLRGGDLATLSDTSETGLRTVLNRLSYQWTPLPNENLKTYWIGLRKIWWKWVSEKNTDVGVAYFRDNPNLDDKGNAGQNCLTADYKQQFAWSIRNCSIQFQTICQGHFEDGGTSRPQTAPAETTSTVTLPVWAVGLISGLAGLVYIVSLIVVGVLCCKCCGKRSQESHGNGQAGGAARNPTFDGNTEDDMEYEVIDEGGGGGHASRNGGPRRRHADSADYELPVN